MAYLDKLRVTFRSATGRRANLELLVAPATTQGQITALLAALAGVSRGAIAHATREVSVAAVNAAVGTSGPYETHRDVLCLRLGHGDGTMSEPKIPCVLETVLLEDGSSLDWTAPAVVALVEAMAAAVVGETESPVVDLRQGWRGYIRNW